MPALLIGGIALLVIGVLVQRGNSCGHDFDFHLLSWMEVARAWHAGLLYPHWVQDANYGAGEPRLIFYPPASWLLGGLLGAVVGWHAAPVLFVLLALLAGGASVYLLARAWAPPPAATFAACLYMAAPYTLFVAYERTAYGELLAGAWLPLMVLFALRPRPSIAPLGLSVAALWLTNSPAAVIGSYLLALLAVGMWIAERKPWPALRALGGMALGLGLAAFYIVPAAFEQRWVQIDRAIISGMRVQDSFLFAHTADAFHDQVLHTASWILIVELAAAVLAAYLAWKRNAGGNARITLTAMLPVILLLQLPASSVLWKYAPHMKFLQFPWRWVMALSVAGCVLASMALDPGAQRAWWRQMVTGGLIVTLAIGGALLFFQPCDDEDAVSAQVAGFRSGQGIQGTDEYTPLGADNAAVQQHLPLVRLVRAAQDDTADNSTVDNPEWHPGAGGAILVGLGARIDLKRSNGEHWMVRIVTPEPGYAVLRLMDYPSWRVAVDGTPILTRPTREDGLMAVEVPAGEHAIDVQWVATRDVLAGRAVSALALLMLAAVAALERKTHRHRPV
jgi:hypothetical protein